MAPNRQVLETTTDYGQRIECSFELSSLTIIVRI